jgi:hypothetical protein
MKYLKTNSIRPTHVHDQRQIRLTDTNNNITNFLFQMDASRKALFQSPHVSSVEPPIATTTTTNNNVMILNTIELENATQFYRSETEKELHTQRLQKIRENIQSLSADAWLYQDPDKLIGFQRVTTH